MAPSGPVPSPPIVMPARVITAITNFLIMDLQPSALVEGEGFRQLLQTLQPSFKEAPTPHQLEGLMREHHDKGRANLLQLLRKSNGAEGDEVDFTAPLECEPRRRGRAAGPRRDVCSFFTLSVEIWLHIWQGCSQRYLTLWAHFIDDSFRLHNFALATQKVAEAGDGDFGLEAVETQVRQIAQEWGILQANFVLLGVEGKNGMRVRRIKSEKNTEASGSVPHPNSTTFLERDDSVSPEDPQVVSEHFSEELPSVPCFFGAVKGCIEEVMLHPVIFKALKQFQDVFTTLFQPSFEKKELYQHQTKKLLQSLTKQEQSRLKAWAHSSPPWNSLYPSLQSLIKHKNVICEIIREIAGENLSKEPSEPSGSHHSNSVPTSTSVLALCSEWKLVEELCLVLKPLDVACRTLAKEAFPRLSLIKPILTGLLSRHLIPRPGGDSSILKEAKRRMRRYLASCYDNPVVNRILSVACSLDPQFQGLGFMEEKEQVDTFNWLKTEAVRIAKEVTKCSAAKKIQKKRSSSPASPESDSDIVRRSKRLKECPPINFRELITEDEFCDAGETDEGESADPRLSGMEFLLGDLFCSTPRSRQSSIEESVDMEMSAFRAERGASLGVEPLQWWRTKGAQFPLLAFVARVYLAAPAVSGNAAQDFVQEGIGTINKKRSNIPPESLDTILFLHHNRIAASDVGQEC